MNQENKLYNKTQKVKLRLSDEANKELEGVFSSFLNKSGLTEGKHKELIRGFVMEIRGWGERLLNAGWKGGKSNGKSVNKK